MDLRGAVYVIDDDTAVARSVATILASLGYAVEAFTTADEFLAKNAADAPACALVDLLLPGTTGLSLCREIVSRNMPCSFLVISGHGDVAAAVEAMRLGAIDFLEKPFSRQRLISGINLALDAARRRYENSSLRQDVSARLSLLSPREREVFDALALGLLTKEISKRFGISTRTVDVHRSRIMHKLRIESPLQLAHFIYLAESCRVDVAVSRIA
jgi:RNA polymerase sigma factor (sigma-70 family)